MLKAEFGKDTGINIRTLKPIGVILDTNILIDLMKPAVYKHADYSNFLSLVKLGFIKILLPKQVKEEWEKHREEKYLSYLDEINKKIKKYHEFASYLKGDERDTFLAQTEKIRKFEKRNYKYNYGLRMRNIDRIIKEDYRTITFDRNNLVDSKIIDLSLNKFDPFFTTTKKKKGEGVKNEMADAIIFFSSYYYLKEYRGEFSRVFFVSSNSSDFAETDNTTMIHPNLKEYLDEVDVEYMNYLGRVNNIVDPDKTAMIIDEAGIEDFLSDAYFIVCNNCKEDIHINADSSILRSKEKLIPTYHLICQECGYEHDTYDSPHDE